MSFKNFDQLSQLMVNFRSKTEIKQTVNRVLNRIDSLREYLATIPTNYTNKYNAVQVLQYDADGKVQDVTPAAQLSVPNSVLSAARQTLALNKDLLSIDAVELDKLQISVDSKIRGLFGGSNSLVYAHGIGAFIGTEAFYCFSSGHKPDSHAETPIPYCDFAPNAKWWGAAQNDCVLEFKDNFYPVIGYSTFDGLVPEGDNHLSFSSGIVTLAQPFVTEASAIDALGDGSGRCRLWFIADGYEFAYDNLMMSADERLWHPDCSGFVDFKLGDKGVIQPQFDDLSGDVKIHRYGGSKFQPTLYYEPSLFYFPGNDTPKPGIEATSKLGTTILQGLNIDEVIESLN